MPAQQRKEIPLPDGFDPRKHAAGLERQIAQKLGDGWSIDHLDPRRKTVVIVKQAAMTEVSESKANTKTVSLARGTKPAEGDRVDAKFADQYPGYYMTSFEPFLGRATLTKLDDESARCRGAAAVALGVKPWDVGVSPRQDGGFELVLPKSYVPSKHDEKLNEVATVIVGRDGWYVDIDPGKLTASIIPSSPPTFAPVIPYPMDNLGTLSQDRLPFGRALPDPGEDTGEEMALDWTSSAFALIGGTPGSGKSVTLNACVAGALASGSELVIVDDQAKAVDFLWAKKFVRDHGWGCDSPQSAVATLAMVYEEGRRRAKVLAQSGYVNWLDMPAAKRFTPITIIVDEVSALLVTDKVPTGVPKDNPAVVEILEENMLKVTLQRHISKIIAEMRFVGIRMILSTQVTNNNTGVGPSLKAKIGHKILQGSNPSKSARGQAFNDDSAVPVVPSNVKSDSTAVKGVGVAELEGVEPTVYKSYFATVDDYLAALDTLGLPTTSTPAPTSAQISAHTPSLDGDDKDDGPAKSRLEDGGFGDGPDYSEPKLKGAAAAAHQLKQAES